VRVKYRGSHGGLSTSQVYDQKKSAIKDHAETTGHETSMENAKIIEKRVQNTHKRLFLESLHSVLAKRSTNEHKLFPSIYMQR
jgi:hypothetical protein